jgi:hypothetical protein
MAKNLLHTHSGYAKGAINKNFLADIHAGKESVDSKIERVERKEEQLYKQFNCNNYNEFLSTLRSLFDEKDRAVIKRFEANSLSQDLERFASKTGYLLNQQVKIAVDLSKLDKLHLTLKDKKGKAQTISFNGVLTMKGSDTPEPVHFHRLVLYHIFEKMQVPHLCKKGGISFASRHEKYTLADRRFLRGMDRHPLFSPPPCALFSGDCPGAGGRAHSQFFYKAAGPAPGPGGRHRCHRGVFLFFHACAAPGGLSGPGAGYAGRYPA